MGIWFSSFEILAGVILVALGIGAVIWYMDYRLPKRFISQYPRCGYCGYNLEGHRDQLDDENERCPECGQRFGDYAVVRPMRSHKRLALQFQRRLVACFIGGVALCEAAWAFVSWYEGWLGRGEVLAAIVLGVGLLFVFGEWWDVPRKPAP